VCPVLDPAATMAAMESGWRFYQRHFERRWRGSLRRKRALFPQVHDFDDTTLRLGMRELTRWLVERHTDFGTLENYFDGYSIAGVGAGYAAGDRAAGRALRLPAWGRPGRPCRSLDRRSPHRW